MAGFGSFGGSIVGLSSQTLADALSVRTRASAPVAPRLTAADLPPWDIRIRQNPDADATSRRLSAGRSVFPEAPPAARDPQISDARKLGAAWTGLAQLKAIADAASAASVTSAERARLQGALQRGWTEVAAYVDQMRLDKISLVRTEKLSRAETEVAIKRNSFDYVGARIHEGAFDAPVAALAGDVRFAMTITRNGVATQIGFDLAEMGAAPRTLDAVVDYVNAKLSAAGFATRLARERLVDPALPAGGLSDDWGFKLDGLESERVRLSAPLVQPSLFAVGQEGVKGSQTTIGSDGKRTVTPTDIAARLQRFNDLGASTPTTVFTERLTSTTAGVRFTSVATAPDGAVYAAGVATGSVDGLSPSGSSDVVLVKYDSQGRKLWTRMMGAEGVVGDPRLAVGPDGRVAVAAGVEGLMDANARGGGRDTALFVYDASGAEVWARQQGAVGHDTPAALAFTADGRLAVAGRAVGALNGAASGAGSDSYLQVFAANGALQSTRQFADAGDSRATALAIAADGEAVLAVVEGGQARVHKVRLDDPLASPTWSYTAGAGEITALAVEGSTIALAGVTLDATMAAVNGGPAHAGGADGFVARLADAPAPSLVWGRFLGTAGTDRIGALALAGGDIFVGGETTGALSGPGAAGARDAFLARLSGADGTLGWTRQMAGRQGDGAIAGMAIDVNGQSGLDAMGLPRGDIQTPESRRIADVAALRPGDHFFLRVEGQSAQRITVGANDTWTSLALRINAALGFSARAEVTFLRGGERLEIKPTSGRRVELTPGETGRDALAGLGLKQGALIDDRRREARFGARTPAPEVVALRMPPNVAFTDAASAAEASKAIDRVMANLRFAHTAATTERNLERPGKRDGQASAATMAQLRNYQAGLRRLTGAG